MRIYRQRIRSVKATKKITRAMELIAARGWSRPGSGSRGDAYRAS